MEQNSSTRAPTTAEEMNDRLPLQEREWFKILLWILYTFIFLLGVGGNAAVCYILYRRKSLRTITNLFILNLAVSDLIFSSSIPLEFPIMLSSHQWPYAAFFCKVYSPVQTIALSVSIFTLTAVSIIRHRAIKYPLKRQVSTYHARYIISGIWFVSVLLLIPHSLTLKIKGKQCAEEWPDITYRKIYTTFLFITLYVIPLFIIVFAYLTIVKELMTKKNCDNSALTEAWGRETDKVIRMFLKVTIVFAVCNLPSQLLWLWLDFGNADQTFPYFWDLLSALNILIFANSAANPFIYYICHDKFRKEAIFCFSTCKFLTWLSPCCHRIRACRDHLESRGVNGKKQEVRNRARRLGYSHRWSTLRSSKYSDKTRESCV